MDRNTTEAKDELVYGIVEEALPNALFRVRLSTDDTNDKDEGPQEEPELVLAYLAGKMRKFRIKVLVGDTVGMVVDPYGGQSRITKRL